MKKLTSIFIVLLLAISFAYADGYPAEEAEHWEKVRQMEQLAERFKAETGFTGNVDHWLERMKLQSYEGKFSDIPFSAGADTTAFRQACDRILDKILPYSYAKRSQLSMIKISMRTGYISTDYYQIVNGYRVEGSGFIVITYDAGRYRFNIGDNTVELPGQNSVAIISEEEAELIALSDKNDEHYNTAKCLKLIYSAEGSDRYYLAYLINVTSIESPLYKDTVYWIDAVTGKVKHYIVDPYIRSNIEVIVRGNYYSTTQDANNINHNSFSIPAEDIKVCIADSTKQTNSSGIAIINGVSYTNQKAILDNTHFYIVAYPSENPLETNTFIPLSTDTYQVDLPDSNHYSPNAYMQAIEHIKGLEVIRPGYYNNYIKIVSNYPFTNNFQLGNFSPISNVINLRDARIHSAVRHELSHHFVERLVGTTVSSLTDTTKQAIDEGLANYFCGSPNNDDLITYFGGQVRMSNCYQVHNYGNPIQEETYSYYINGIPLASAWWSLRNNAYFPADGQKNGVDTLLVAGLDKVRQNINQNSSYRYKPRYFYNIMMSRVEDDNIPWPLNNKQTAINNAYNERGFHFYPEVMSAVSANYTNPGESETYNVLDSVYVHVKNCPQNTLVRVSVVLDGSYGNVGASGITMPSAIEVDGNPVCIVATTDSTGVWAGAIPFSNMLPQGDYDIIVDVGSPTAPDGRLNLVFANDNIIDGVDGLQEPGFTKIGFGDMVVALDLSSSMQGYATHLGKTVKALVQSMIPSERINVFGFTEGTANQNWLENGFVD